MVLRGRTPGRRFIPAPAGNTCVPVISGKVIHGSSPRLRGTPTLRPAAVRRTPVHPRACGEHLEAEDITGSAHRFIPAPAGNTPRRSRPPTRPPVHPRACGEHPVPSAAPRRGSRFIPAPAGNTDLPPDVVRRRDGSSPRLRGTPTTSPGTSASPTVHPRACGEHPGHLFDGPSLDGSSPRLRGTPAIMRCLEYRLRFIPAPAGNTRTLISGTRALHGSSPRLRGTRRPRCPRR